MNPYIGVTDFTNLNQVQEMSQIFKAHLPSGSNRMLHIGVMMSYKTLHSIPTVWQKTFPPKEHIASIFSVSDEYRCLHYVDYDNHPNLNESLALAISYGEPGIDSIQLDMTWPNPSEIAKGIKASQKPVEVILQIGDKALKEVNNSPQKVVERLKTYEGIIHRVLLDKSMGRGLGLNAKELIPFALAIREHFPVLGIGAAGGLGPRTLHLLDLLISYFPDLSIDAQAQLHVNGNSLDPVDWNKVIEYLIKALSLFK